MWLPRFQPASLFRALANQRSAGENHGDHGEIADDLHHRGEPTRFQIRIELYSRNHLDRWTGQSFALRYEVGHIVDDNGLDFSHAVEGMGNRGGVDIDLDRRPPPGDNIRLELRRSLDDEKETFRIHRPVGFRRCNLRCRLESGWGEAIRNAA